MKIVQSRDSLVLVSMQLKYSRLLLTFNIDLCHISEFVCICIFLYENVTLGVGDSLSTNHNFYQLDKFVTKDIVTFKSPSGAIQFLINVSNPAGSVYTVFLCLDKLRPLTLFLWGDKRGIESRLPFSQMTQRESSTNVGMVDWNELKHKRSQHVGILI